ncbi:MAG: PAS domain S-box protein [Methanofollis sp.]|uniref:PAS domain S-box protein n=1 Tax=Methanofollis sp. TaxID=2052835 RepID=UPI00261AF9F4|nr:PAS domain S-box protein [Methanofollis sp.]MDD4253942.1 PAS domain S-box protein [Methanofollis sp.]
MISLLCVDDKPGAIDHIRRDLEETGDFSVTTSRSGEEALNLLKKQPFDIILSGREMPDMKGVDLLQAARESGCHTPFIFFDDFNDRNRVPDSQDSEGRPTALLSCLSSIAAEQQIPDQSANRSETLFRAIADKTDDRTIEYFTPRQTIGDETTGRVWSFSDITERKEAEKNLKEREHFFTTLLGAIRDGVLILSGNGTVDYANRAACELTGLPSAEDCVGRNILEFVHQDSAHAIFRDLLTVRGGPDAIPAEYTFVTPSGKVRQVEGLSSTIAWKEKTVIAVTLRDITERKQAAAQENADLNRALIDGLPEYIIVLTRDGEIIFANPAAEAASRCAQDALTGKTLRTFIAESSLQDFDTAIQDALTGQKRRSFEIGIRTAADEGLQVTLRAAPIAFQNRDAVLVLLTDLTERLILEKELEYHAEELKRFSESLARTNEKLTIMNSITRHDILNQLTVLLGYLEIAAEESTEPEVRESLRMIQFSAQNIREQLEFARDYQDLGVREPQWLDVRWQVAKLRQDGITIETRIEEDGALTIVWEDNGIGVREGEKEKIFRRGYGNNTGLGLFLCREILKITGIGIRETGEYEKGARFEIRVPEEGYRVVQKPATVPDPA